MELKNDLNPYLADFDTKYSSQTLKIMLLVYRDKNRSYLEWLERRPKLCPVDKEDHKTPSLRGLHVKGREKKRCWKQDWCQESQQGACMQSCDEASLKCLLNHWAQWCNKVTWCWTTSALKNTNFRWLQSALQNVAAFIEGDKMQCFSFPKLGIKLTFTVTCMLKNPTHLKGNSFTCTATYVLDAPFTYVSTSAFLRFCIMSTTERI